MVLPSNQYHNYPFLNYRTKVWQEIIRYVAQDCPPIQHLLELGPGFCDFINNFPAAQKTCLERNQAMQQYVNPGIRFLSEEASRLSGVDDQSVDLVFASNFLEHLGEEAHQVLLPNIHRVLDTSGRLILIQPNYRLNPDRYFDDPTHLTIFSDQDITAFLNGFGFIVCKLIPRFLPFSMQSRFPVPKWPILVRLYLASPLRPFAGQMYIVAQKR